MRTLPCALCQRYGDQELDAICIMTNMDHLHISLIFHVAKISKENNPSRSTSGVTVPDKEFSDFPLEMWRSVTTGWLSRNVHLLLKLVPYGHRNKRKGFCFVLYFLLKQNKTSSKHWTTGLLPFRVTLSVPIIAGLETHIVFWKLSSMLEANSLNNRDVTVLSICFQIHF